MEQASRAKISKILTLPVFDVAAIFGVARIVAELKYGIVAISENEWLPNEVANHFMHV
jgi:hypothetical protein